MLTIRFFSVLLGYLCGHWPQDDIQSALLQLFFFFNFFLNDFHLKFSLLNFLKFSKSLNNSKLELGFFQYFLSMETITNK